MRSRGGAGVQGRGRGHVVDGLILYVTRVDPYAAERSGRVPTKLTVLVGLAFVLVSCGKPKPSPAPCGLSPSDWCPSPPGDPCGEHKEHVVVHGGPALQGNALPG